MILSNILSSSRYLKEPYNYEPNLLGNVKIGQILRIAETALQICPECKIRKKNHYCIEQSCKRRELICPECDVNKISQKHYLHDYSYVLPFLTKDIFANYYQLKKKIVNFHGDILGEIKKIQDYLKELYKVERTVGKQISRIQEEEEVGKIREYIEKMTDFIQKYQSGQMIKDRLDNVLFLSMQECQKRQEEMKNQIIASLDGLKWPRDPQKVLKEKLKGGPEEEKKEVFISKYKPLELNEIDNHFKANTEFFTESLKSHMVEIRLQSDLLGKPKYYESFIYHFRDCQKLFIENGNITHLKTPLTFRNLKTLEFNFSLEAQPLNIKLDVCTDQLQELSFQRFREEDLKLLKQITLPCNQLKKFHVQFSNKIDLYHCKDLVELLRHNKLKHLVSLTIKIRTENEVKRLYGYLSKFFKDQGDSLINLNSALIELVESSKYLTKLVIEGVKPLEMPILVSKMKKLCFLMNYKIYFENVDMMTEVEDRESKYLESICEKRKRIFYALAKASKKKYLPKTIIDHVITDYLI